MQIDRIVIHCSDSPHGRGDNAETIHQWHLERGWSGIGYHFVITEEGEIETGRPLYWKGAHVVGYNANSIGICLIGDHFFSKEQKDKLCLLVSILLDDFPKAQVFNHYDLDPNKTCPNFDAAAMVRQHIYENTPH